MNKFIINGYDKLGNDYGIKPSFHDDTIEKIEISLSDITFFIKPETITKNKELDPTIKLVFKDVKEFSLEGELFGCVSIILDLEFQEFENIIEAQLSSSLGTSGTILCKSIQVELV